MFLLGEWLRIGSMPSYEREQETWSHSPREIDRSRWMLRRPSMAPETVQELRKTTDAPEVACGAGSARGPQWRDRCSGLQGYMVTDNKCALRPLTAFDTAARAKWCRLIPRGYSLAWVTASTLGRRPCILNGRSHHCHSGKVWKTQGWPTRQPSRVHLQIRATI